jgi:integrase
MVNNLKTLENTLEDALVSSSSTQSRERYYARKAYAENTYRAYRSDLKDFTAWTGIANPIPTTATVIRQYLVDRAEVLSPTTLEHRLAALSFVHRLLDYQDPTQDEQLKAVLRGIKKTRVQRGWIPAQAPAFTLKELLSLLRGMGGSLHDWRDKAYILLGLFGAFRQSEMTALTAEQLEFVDEGLIIKMGPTKGDPMNETRQLKAIPKGRSELCPVKALTIWMTQAEITQGVIFRGIDRNGRISERPLSHTTTNRIIKKWVTRAGLNEPERYSGHSLRASFITVARELKIPDHRIALQSHHRDLRVIETYYRPAMAFDQNPAKEVMAAMGELLEN